MSASGHFGAPFPPGVVDALTRAYLTRPTPFRNPGPLLVRFHLPDAAHPCSPASDEPPVVTVRLRRRWRGVGSLV